MVGRLDNSMNKRSAGVPIKVVGENIYVPGSKTDHGLWQTVTLASMAWDLSISISHSF